LARRSALRRPPSPLPPAPQPTAKAAPPRADRRPSRSVDSPAFLKMRQENRRLRESRGRRVPFRHRPILQRIRGLRQIQAFRPLSREISVDCPGRRPERTCQANLRPLFRWSYESGPSPRDRPLEVDAWRMQDCRMTACGLAQTTAVWRTLGLPALSAPLGEFSPREGAPAKNQDALAGRLPAARSAFVTLARHARRLVGE
jgi:hypothetical protein